MGSTNDIFDLFEVDTTFIDRYEIPEGEIQIISESHREVGEHHSLDEHNSFAIYATNIFERLLLRHQKNEICLKSILIYLGYIFNLEARILTPSNNENVGVLKGNSPISLIRECVSNVHNLLESTPDKDEKINFKTLSNFTDHPTPFNTDARNLHYVTINENCLIGKYLNYYVMRVDNFDHQILSCPINTKDFLVIFPFIDDYLFNIWIPLDTNAKCVLICDHSNDSDQYIERLERLIYSYYLTEQREILGMLFYLMCCKPLFRKGNEDIVACIFKHLCPEIDFGEMEKRCYSLLAEYFVDQF